MKDLLNFVRINNLPPVQLTVLYVHDNNNSRKITMQVCIRVQHLAITQNGTHLRKLINEASSQMKSLILKNENWVSFKEQLEHEGQLIL